MLRLSLLSGLAFCLSCTDLGPVECTEVDCNSSLVITVDHALPLSEGGHLLELDTPNFELRCSIPSDESGTESCFGFRFATMTWDQSQIVITLTEPFFDTDLNPEADPWSEVSLSIQKEGAEVAGAVIPVDGGEPQTPNGEDCPPVCWEATASASL